MKTTIVAVLLVAAAATAYAQAPTSVVELSNTLDGAREACSTLAVDLSGKDRSEQFQRRLDSQLAMQQLRNDVSIYGIGHGRNQTNQHMLDLMQQNAEKEKNDSVTAATVSEERRASVASCVTEKLAAGKDTYAIFKKKKLSKADADAALALVTSWLVNVESISLTQPGGSVESSEDWKKARAQAELQSL